MDKSQNPLFAPKKPRQIKKATNFAEALLEIGGHTAKATKDAFGNIAGKTVDTFTGNLTQQSEELKANQEIDIDSQLKEQEQKILQEQEKKQRHQEVIQTTVYNREKEETKSQIKAIQLELRKIATELANMGTQIDKSIDEEVVDPGTYHVTFFVKIRQFLIQLRKRVSESKNWMALSANRKKSKGAYWRGVKKSGTKYMLSQERYMSTSGG